MLYTRLINKNAMVVLIWYIRDRCPEYAFLSPRSQQNWLLFLSAEFRSTRELTARAYPPSERTRSDTKKTVAQSLAQEGKASVDAQREAERSVSDQ